MKVGIIGSGNVGQALGKGFAKLKYEVKIGSRNPDQDKIKDLIKSMGKLASAGTFDKVASFGEIIVLATSWSGTENAVKLSNPKNLENKIVIDVTNPLDFSEGKPKLALGYNNSAGETIQKLLPKSKVVKAFNMVGNAHMVNPDFPNGPPDMFICGNDEEAKQKVTEILTKFGWSTIDIGEIENSRLLEPLAMLWITYGIKTNSWNHAFKLLKK
ncbi:NADPH-dependent F420 reductase [Candidatus Woesearchaeota archaeon]|nr:NADPH-dependent F420 reductase [Candidatus Woesearchaeota archaeon]